MHLLSKSLLLGLVASLVTTQALRAETNVNVTGVHLCCGKCVKAVEGALAKVEGVQGQIDQKAGTVAISAADDKTAQKAINAIARAGFHGKLDNNNVHFRPGKAPEGKVERLELVGLHNCCAGCCKAIKAALAGVEGVQADTAEPHKTSVVIEGNFSAAAAVEALFNAGFHCRLPKAKAKKK